MNNCFSINSNNQKAGFTLLETAICMLIGLSLLGLTLRWGRTNIIFGNALEKKIENCECLITLVKKLEEVEESFASSFFRRNPIVRVGNNSCLISFPYRKEEEIKSREGLSRIGFRWIEDRFEIFGTNTRDSVFPVTLLRVFAIARTGIEPLAARRIWNGFEISGLLFSFSFSEREGTATIRIPFIFRTLLCNTGDYCQGTFKE